MKKMIVISLFIGLGFLFVAPSAQATLPYLFDSSGYVHYFFSPLGVLFENNWSLTVRAYVGGEERPARFGMMFHHPDGDEYLLSYWRDENYYAMGYAGIWAGEGSVFNAACSNTNCYGTVTMYSSQPPASAERTAESDMRAR